MALADGTVEERVVLNATNMLMTTLFIDNPQLLIFLSKASKN
jgi:hypothetical protein